MSHIVQNIELGGLTWGLLYVRILAMHRKARPIGSASGDRTSDLIHVYRMTENSASGLERGLACIWQPTRAWGSPGTGGFSFYITTRGNISGKKNSYFSSYICFVKRPIIKKASNENKRGRGVCRKEGNRGRFLALQMISYSSCNSFFY